jgi:tetratricopeptide (TPR) repeat protein
MISAMLHNMAALRANQVRIADCFGEALPEEGKWAFVEADSTQSYDMGIGTLSLQSFIPLVRAQLLVAESRFAEAIPLYSASLDHPLQENLRRRESCFFADRAWCLVHLGQPDQARGDVEAAIRTADAITDVDDIAAAHARVARVFERLGQSGSAASHREIARSHLEHYRLSQGELIEQLLRELPPRNRGAPA